ncbi:alpha/beta hydrolase [Ulvibacter antarcticus]|uniref:Pimeloyl-ACP methyl ester carboxylesterase n=1 Tax=Ulvibacter antarcticus TaxID=442714 RepID=A0A3L9Y6F1_9FLAO|nr:alpha/beta hydrolase [Ulvibacter antarcticus]RMA56281.1 pimeloyl-ACP methyl ester carboxylesterase [Ulvibacter antarcticus]
MKLIIFLCICITSQCFGQNPDSLYLNFTKAYDSLNAESIANLYLENAEVLNLYDGEKSSSMKGKVEVQKYYKEFFERFKSNDQKLKLTFKIVTREKVGENILDNGFYQLEFITQNMPSFFTFGKFSTVLEFENDIWKFKTDATTNTDFVEYENSVESKIPERDEPLFSEFYDNLLGNYISDDGQLIVIGRSLYRLYAYYEKTGEYRALNKVNATTWTIGKTIISNEIQQTYKFSSNKIEIYDNDKLVNTATKKQLYKSSKVTYANVNGIKIGGTLFVPNQSNGKAIVLVHGSGPQDRNGYASIIRLLADILSRDGTTVLTYDKQGIGQSEGNWASENFAELAQDAIAGIDFLKSNKELSLSKIGIGGSSQAGWIIAKAIEKRQDIDFALTIGAAGSGIPVVEQNIYNTEVVLKCDGSFSKKQIENIITQQKYFFYFLSNPKQSDKLDKFTKSIEKDEKIRDWLFPTSKQMDLNNRNQWFTALEVNFDPLPVWKKYDNPVLMIFSEFDDSTPASKVKSKVDNLKKKNIRTIILPNAQHIGLENDSVCVSNIGGLSKFQKDFFKEMKIWIKSL